MTILAGGAASAMENQEELAQFRSNAEALQSIQDLRSLMVDALARLEIIGFAIGHLQGGHRPTTLFVSTWPRRLLELYAINSFMTDDPVVLGAVAYSEPFTWPDQSVDRSSTNRVLTTFRRFGFASGLAVPVHGPGNARGVVAFLAGQKQFPSKNRSFQVDFARCCYAVARRLHDRSTGRAKLTTRERQALSLVAKGFDDSDIGEALGVTRTSAHAYVERAKRRLGAKTRAQAVALAMADDALAN